MDGGGGRETLRSWANANRGVCGQAVPSLPSPSPFIPFFLLSSQFSRRTRAEPLATQAKEPTAYIFHDFSKSAKRKTGTQGVLRICK